MSADPVSVAGIGHRDHHWPVVRNKPHMGDQPLIEDRMGDGLILDLALGITDFGIVGLIGHSCLLLCCTVS